MDTEAASALPVKIGSHSSSNLAMNFLDKQNISAVWLS
ncbi:hypothetical protein GALL_193040 [mine drainage metagenome]|uniref:Uncharacterized protein n=1 Tax=mine drainage metagenome TaxID=410659 RepID=A0A1J5RRN5_9ZZZZ